VRRTVASPSCPLAARRRAQPVEGANHRLFFPAQRAAGHQHRAIERHAEKAQHPLGPALGNRRALQRVELEAAGNDDLRGVHAKGGEPPRRLFALHAEAADVGEHAPEPRHQPVASERPRRDAPVDHHRGHAPLAALAQQVRPDLGFDHQEQPRAHHAQRAPHREHPVEGEVEGAVHVGHALARELLPREGGGGEKQAQLRIALAQFGKHRPGRQHLAHRHRVHPDGVLAVEIERHRQVSQPLAQAPDVLVVPERLVHEVRGAGHQREQREDAIEEIHC
jgi:hypothetical protein